MELFLTGQWPPRSYQDEEQGWEGEEGRGGEGRGEEGRGGEGRGGEKSVHITSLL